MNVTGSIEVVLVLPKRDWRFLWLRRLRKRVFTGVATSYQRDAYGTDQIQIEGLSSIHRYRIGKGQAA